MAMWAILLAATVGAAEPTQVEFPSEDGVIITADLYAAHVDPKTPFIVLFHQAGWSRPIRVPALPMRLCQR